MILTCPNCATRYLIDPGKLGVGRDVRCAKCQHEWWQQPAPPEPAPTPSPSAARPDAAQPATAAATAPPPVVEAAPPRLRPVPAGSNLPALRQETKSRAGIGWLALAVVVLLVGVALFAARETIIERLPQTAPLYAAIGLAEREPAQPFVTRDLKTDQVREDGKVLLVVSGEIVNTGARALRPPPMRIALRDATRQEIEFWLFESDAGEVPPGGAVPFTSRRPLPAVPARDLEITFVRPEAGR